MKKIALIITLFCLACSTFAYDFSSISPSGHTLYYNIVGGSYVYITYKDYAYDPGTISGDLIIPSTVTYQGHTYPVKKIGENAFYKCSGLLSVVIGDTVSEIEFSAFEECINLSSITIPSSVTIISDAFYGCISLQNVYYMGNISQWLGISFLGALTSNPVYYSKRLYLNGVLVTTLTIPQGTTTIPKNSFCGLSTIEQIFLPNSVLSIDDYAFNSCSGLNKVVMPYVHRIGHKAFENCSSIDTIICENSTPPICLSDSPFHNIATFDGVPMDARIIIPCHSEDDYRNAEGWNYFVFFESNPTVPQIEVNSANPSMGSAHYNFLNYCMDSVIAVATPFSGFHFDHWSNGETSNPYYFLIEESPITLTAFFAESTVSYYQVSLTVNDITMGGTTGGGQYQLGDTAVCTAIPFEGFSFRGWSNGSQDNPYSFVVTTNVELMAVFVNNIGLEEKDENVLFSVYPNPAETFVTINTSVDKNPLSIKIQDVVGHVVKEEIINGAYTNVDVNGLSKGVYFVRVGKHVQKLLIIR